MSSLERSCSHGEARVRTAPRHRRAQDCRRRSPDHVTRRRRPRRCRRSRDGSGRGPRRGRRSGRDGDQGHEQNRTVFTSHTAVLTRMDAFTDALTSTPLAAALKAPVLPTASDDLDDRVLEVLKKAGVKRVVAIGGERALRPAVLAELLRRHRGRARRRYRSLRHRSTGRRPGAEGAWRRLCPGVRRDRRHLSRRARRRHGSCRERCDRHAVRWWERRPGDECLPQVRQGRQGHRSWRARGGRHSGDRTAGLEVVGADRYETALKLAQLVFSKPRVWSLPRGRPTQTRSPAALSRRCTTGHSCSLTPSRSCRGSGAISLRSSPRPSSSADHVLSRRAWPPTCRRRRLALPSRPRCPRPCRSLLGQGMGGSRRPPS